MQPSKQSETAAPTSASDAVLPEFWPSQGKPPVRPVWIPWPIAVALAPLFWLMPKRFGPHFAAAGWRAAVAAHVVWGFYGLATLVVAFGDSLRYSLAHWLFVKTPTQGAESLWASPTLGEVLRAPLAVLVNGLFAMMNSGGRPTIWFLRIVIWCLAAEGLLALAALLLMPYLAAGERGRLLFGRSVRLVLWATTSLVALGVALQTTRLWYTDETMVLLGTMVYMVWLVWLVIRGGVRYAGPADGPAWQPRVPMCEGCGYTLTALPPSASCPECGRPVVESLPERRGPCRFGAARHVLGRLAAYGPTYAEVLWSRDFFARLRVSDAMAGARRFAIWTCGLLALAGAAVDLGWLGWSRTGSVFAWPRDMDVLAACTVGSIAGLALLLVVGLIALLASRFAVRPGHPNAVAVFYWTAWLAPIAISVAGTIALVVWLIDLALFRWVVQAGNLEIDMYGLAVSLLAVIPCAVIWRAIVALVRAVRAMRLANA